MTDTWERIHDAALTRHEDGGAELARLVIEADDPFQALTARVAELEAALKRWETAAANGSIYTRKNLEDAVAAALEEAAQQADDMELEAFEIDAIDPLGEEYWPSCVADKIRALIKDPSILAKRDAQMKAEGMREAAGIAQKFHEEAMKWAATYLSSFGGETDSARIATAILARADEIERGEG